MADKYTDDKLYKVVRKDGSHLNTKVNPDGTKSALQFTDDNNDLNGPVDLIEVDEEELIRTEYIQVPQNKRSLGELLVDEVFVPVIRDATTQLLEYGTAKAETWIEEKVVPVAKTKVKLSKYCSNEGNIYTESLGNSAYQNNPKFKKFIADYQLGFKAYAQFGKAEIMERTSVLIQLVQLIWNDEMFK